MPLLRDHLEDLPELADVLLTRACGRFRCPMRPLGAIEFDRLAAYSWPGNVRELDRALQRWLFQGMFPPQLAGEPAADRGDARVTRVRGALARHGGDKSAAARELGISRTSVYRWLGRETSSAKV
jgi:transcriptional regulator with PAS, ATPase and Fis domain